MRARLPAMTSCAASCPSWPRRRTCSSRMESSSGIRTGMDSCAATAACPARPTSTSRPRRSSGSACGTATSSAARCADRRTTSRYFALLRADAVNSRDPEESRRRVQFQDLTPLHPDEHLKLEHDPSEVSTRLIDLFCPIGKDNADSSSRRRKPERPRPPNRSRPGSTRTIPTSSCSCSWSTSGRRKSPTSSDRSRTGKSSRRPSTRSRSTTRASPS